MRADGQEPFRRLNPYNIRAGGRRSLAAPFSVSARLNGEPTPAARDDHDERISEEAADHVRDSHCKRRVGGGL